MSNEDEKYLGSILSDTNKVKREAVKRKRDYITESVKKSLAQHYIEDGWEIDKELKTKTRLRKRKLIDERLEDRLWFLLSKLGYPELNDGRNFRIKISRKGADPTFKQIDIFAKDDETVIVAECKASERLRKRSLQKDIEEFANLKRGIAQSVKSYYGRDFKPKIIWLFVTENIIWSKPDEERAKGEKIHKVTEKELRYYQQIADHLGKAGRYQFLSEFLKNQKIPELKDKTIPAIRGKLGGKYFYSFVTTPRDLLKISFVNHRSLNDPDGAPSYQRLISRTRMHQIGKFLREGGFFPTNILVNFTSKTRFDTIVKDSATDVHYGQLYLPDKYRSAWIIDGQHRLYGYAHLADDFLDQNIIVVAFENLPTEEEANLFVTINHEQKSVPKTLLDDLEGELKWGSDVPTEKVGAIAARLIGTLNVDLGGPFYSRVTQQGIKGTDRICLTVPALKDGIRRSGLIGRAILKRKEYEPGPLSDTSDSLTLDRSRSVINSYFNLIKNCNPRQWDKGRLGHLCINASIQAYLSLFTSIIEYMEVNKALTARELNPDTLVMEIEEYLNPILEFISNASDSEMEQYFKVPFGSGGPKEYYFKLCKILKNEFGDFNPDGMEDWETEQSDEKITDADQKIKDLNIKVQSFIFEVFKKIYGEKNDAYWEKGVIDKNIKMAAYGKSQEYEVEDRLPLENYLEFIEYKKIVENKAHWA